ncbi:MAG: neutral/alkaline non-lysosomal ceramidase N-terminal domain-containing protein [Gemmataceae bacterium]|nr:neutral/alkaline non-lysosomal ceramidase N-terminal domain-containing protein [Gemmataceae bacterium]
MKTISLIACVVGGLVLSSSGRSPTLRVGFGACDITPALDKKVYIAGFGKNRVAKGVHDPLMARVIVLADGQRKIALASVDLVGLFLPVVERIRQRLPGFAYVLVSSTHNHEGPDTLGLWGPNAFVSGVDPAYLKQVEDGVVKAIQQADRQLAPAAARLGRVPVPELLNDSREPYVKHDDLVALQLDDPKGKTIGLVVQWNCHPEDLGAKNTEISADYVWATVAHLHEQHACPVVYLTGTVGGLMSSLRLELKDGQGNPLKEGTFARTEAYGRLVGKAADKAIAAAKPVTLTPFAVERRDLFLPIDNQLYLLAWKLGVLDRQSYRWTGDWRRAEPLGPGDAKADLRKCIKTEIGWLRLGDLDVAAIPGEIYPELVLGKVQDPPDAGADFPKAAVEPSIYGQLTGKHRMIVGLANDEIGYIIPKRQWDEKPPYCYGRMRRQYGEENSLGPETAPLLCEAFRVLTRSDR